MKELLFKPFEKYSETKLLLFGIIITSIGLFVGNLFNMRFNGAIDVHFGTKVTMIVSLLDFGIVLLCLFTFLFLAAKIVNRKTRFIDVLSTVIVSRSIIYILSLFNANGSLGLVSDKLTNNQGKAKEVFLTLNNNELLLIVISGITSILITIWYVALLYNGYKTASNAKGSKPTVLFIVSILFAEIVSAVLIYNYNK